MVKDPLGDVTHILLFTFTNDSQNNAISWPANASMTPRFAAWRNAFRQKSSFSRKTADIPSITLPYETLMEEETLPHYKAEQYYPVNIGDIYGARYQVGGKIGYGAYSTSWLCRDLQCVPSARPAIASAL